MYFPYPNTFYPIKYASRRRGEIGRTAGAARRRERRGRLARACIMKDLQRFILRSVTLKLYRDCLRVVRRLAPEHAAPELRREIRSRFAAHATEGDPVKVRRLHAECKTQLELLEGMLISGRG